MNHNISKANMNNFNSLPYQMHFNQAYNYWNPYFQSGPAFYNYYEPSFYHQEHPQKLSVIQNQPLKPFSHQVIKVEEDSIQKPEQKKKVKKQENLKASTIPRKKKYQSRVIEQNKNIYDHPPKFVHHRVKYFDPYSSPVVTAADYNLIQGVFQQNERSKIINSIGSNIVDDTKYPELDANPFIVFKYRRIKKKFKKYTKLKDEFLTFNKIKSSQEFNVNLSSIQNQDSSSESSQSQSNNLLNEKPEDQQIINKQKVSFHQKDDLMK